MTQYQVTVKEEDLHELFSGAEGMQGLVESFLNRILEAEVTDNLKAAPFERSEERRAYRNGYRHRAIKTGTGTIDLRVPKVRSGSFSSELFQRYQRSEQSLMLALMEMVVNGVSSHKVTRITETLCGTSFSKSTTSELCKSLDRIVKTWREQPLDDDEYPFVIVDAIAVKNQEDEGVISRSLMIAVGISSDGYRRILGLMIGESESEATWSQFFSHLKERGLRGVDIVVSDKHKGLVNAVGEHLQGALWQRCQLYLTRNILESCPRRYAGELRHELREVFYAADITTARNLRDEIISEYSKKAKEAMECLDEGFEDAVTVMALPEPYRRPLATTNSVERLNREVRRRIYTTVRT